MSIAAALQGYRFLKFYGWAPDWIKGGINQSSVAPAYDGGSLITNFSPRVSMDLILYLILGEVGGQCGEFVNAYVQVSGEPIDPVPEPATMLLLGSGLAGLAFDGRRRFKETAAS